MFSYILPSGILIVSKNKKIVKSLPIEFRVEENQTLITIPEKLDEQEMKEISVGLGFFALRSFSHPMFAPEKKQCINLRKKSEGKKEKGAKQSLVIRLKARSEC